MFIDKYLTTKIKEEKYTSDFTDSDQMRYEHRLRDSIAKRDIDYPDDIKNLSWNYYYSFANPFVDFSTFYSTLTYVSFKALSYIESKEDKSVDAILWTYGAVSIWCNGEKAFSLDVPVYKPITKKVFKLNLKRGWNEIYVQFQNLGVRDTRNIFALEIPDCDEVSVSTRIDEAEKISKWLDDVDLVGRTLYFPSPALPGTTLGRDSHSPDYGLVQTRTCWSCIDGLSSIELEDGDAYIILQIDCKYGKLKRFFEIGEMVRPEYTSITDRKENYKRMLSVIASAQGLSRGDKFGFYIQNILARKALGIENKNDREYFLITLKQIEDRYDCSDFLISGVIRYVKNYHIDEELSERIKDVLRNYRYWMNMEGSDAMCFWSENHSLLFYSCAMLVGQMYPDMYFPRARMTGRELALFGRKLSMQWFDDLDEYGFEEFLSTVYMNVTFACLLNIIDYGDDEISKRATSVADKMLRMLSMHTFSGSIIAPMGRVYRGVINPSKQGAQALMNLVNPKVPTSFGEGWLSYYATSKYKIPNDLIHLMEDECNVCYSTGNAQIKLLKKEHYCLTSVQSPRQDEKQRWSNITLDDDAMKYENTHIYTKSFNERFHGTTYFQPGVYGYQQHMWTVALDNQAIAFSNHPGAFSDHSSMRPGYWYGNGVMPALRQDKNVLGAIYVIPQSHPVGFTHLYIPSYFFDRVECSENWVFASKGKGYLAIWSSCVLERYNDELADAELRSYGRDNCYFCIAGDENEYGCFDSFKKIAKQYMPEYDNHQLFLNGKLYLNYQESHDETQFV